MSNRSIDCPFALFITITALIYPCVYPKTRIYLYICAISITTSHA